VLASVAAADADFWKWWPRFQAAVARSDAKAVAAGAHFPLQWENGPIRDIKSQADFDKRFEVYFTPEIRKMVATKKPEDSGYGQFAITWKARGNEYSLILRPEGGTYILEALTEGPP
jgi:hypothetical protein